MKVNKYLEAFWNKDDFIKETCLPKCPLECTQIQVSTALAFYKYPTLLQVNESLFFLMPTKFSNETYFWKDFNSIYNFQNNLTVVHSVRRKSGHAIRELSRCTWRPFAFISWHEFVELV